jgi:hypothetical protein
VVRAKIKQISHDKEKKILVLQKKKKFLKKVGLSKRDKRSLRPFIQGGLHCECDRINVTLNENYIIMGNYSAPGEFTAMYIAKWRKDKVFRKALKLMRKRDICSKPLDIGDNSIGFPGISTGGKGSGNKGKKKGKGKKGKGKKGKGKGKKGKKGKGKKGKKGKGKKGKGKGNKNKNKKNRNKKGRKGGKGRKNKKRGRQTMLTTLAPSS